MIKVSALAMIGGMDVYTALHVVAALNLEPANDNLSPWERLADSLRWSDFIAWLRKDLDSA